MTVDLELAVHEAVAAVDDPEYPGVSIVDLGLLESIDIQADGRIEVGLIPTFSGCSALGVIAEDVERSVSQVAGVTAVDVRWLKTPVWDASRISADARGALADQFTVAVQLGDKPAACPRCGASTEIQSMFGPTRCRAVHRCTSCGETVEVMRS